MSGTEYSHIEGHVTNSNQNKGLVSNESGSHNPSTTTFTNALVDTMLLDQKHMKKRH